MRLRGIENCRLTVALGGNAANFDEPLPYDDSYAKALSLYLSSSGRQGDARAWHRIAPRYDSLLGVGRSARRLDRPLNPGAYVSLGSMLPAWCCALPWQFASQRTPQPGDLRDRRG